MTREELVQALRRMAVETGSIACLGCGYEHKCAIQGCAIINAAALEIGLLEAENGALREQLEASRRDAMTPQQAAKILRSANLSGVLRTAAELGAEALESHKLKCLECGRKFILNTHVSYSWDTEKAPEEAT